MVDPQAGREVLYGAFAVEGCHLCAVLDPPPHVHAFNRDADGNEVLTAVRTAKPAASGPRMCTDTDCPERDIPHRGPHPPHPAARSTDDG